MSYHYKMQLWGNGPILEVVACHQFKSTAKMSQHNFFCLSISSGDSYFAISAFYFKNCFLSSHSFLDLNPQSLLFLFITGNVSFTLFIVPLFLWISFQQDLGYINIFLACLLVIKSFNPNCNTDTQWPKGLKGAVLQCSELLLPLGKGQEERLQKPGIAGKSLFSSSKILSLNIWC